MPWWLLQPDVDHTLLTEGLGPEDQRAVAARTADGSLAIVYLPDRREITVDLAQFAGQTSRRAGTTRQRGDFSRLPARPSRRRDGAGFSPEPQNSSGFDDWALVLESPA